MQCTEGCCDHAALTSTEGLQSKTGVSSVVTIDSILPQPRFHQSYDIGTGPLYGDSVHSAGTRAVIEAACSEVQAVVLARQHCRNGAAV